MKFDTFSKIARLRAALLNEFHEQPHQVKLVFTEKEFNDFKDDYRDLFTDEFSATFNEGKGRLLGMDVLIIKDARNEG